MFCLGSDISIGKFEKVKPHEVKIEKSIHSYVDKAVIKLPITARIKQAGVVITESVETAKQFSEGDKVVIKLGYNGSLKTEFEGFVSRVNFTSPLEIECEGYSYQLRKQSYTRTFKNVQLLDIMKYLVTGTDIVLDEKQIPSFLINKFVLTGQTGTEALEKFKKDYAETMQFIFTGNILYAGLLGLDYKSLKDFPQKPDVNYRLGWNVIKDGNLKLHQAKNQDVVIKGVSEERTGKRITIISGTHKRTIDQKIKHTGGAGITGETKIIKLTGLTDQGTIKKVAEAKNLQLSYDGYEGKITAFLVPYCEPAYRAAIEDKKYPERGGSYLVESVEVDYGMSGARRIVGLGLKL